MLEVFRGVYRQIVLNDADPNNNGWHFTTPLSSSRSADQLVLPSNRPIRNPIGCKQQEPIRYRKPIRYVVGNV